MNRLPFLLHLVLLYPLGFAPTLLWKSVCDVSLIVLGATYLSIFISIGLLRWRGLPLNATVGEYNERVRFLRNEVTRISTDNDGPSG
ncbi:hypothetical protein NLM33_43330 [Bradyrhizobium sp. CCGUVB1N3]|uniref:hypothetical protein n=1 Tax=Bradyrhizobium sp. CCGUVB1N3 TaxID=2949629 RepID=UPI0020B3BABA|nr:hypothetical protein [Bradyrhizobium sp. CCGUVB1N3]MCP3476994.1 hypothetical protein [Bradyrhizobium sp. CCGUVB1N3]